MESEYDGEFAGLGLRDNLEDGTGSVREEIVIRSVIILFEKVFRRPTKMVSPSTK